MKKIYFYIGLDVHKKTTSYAVRDDNGNIVIEGKCSSVAKDLYDILEPYLHSSLSGLECNIESYPVYDYFKAKSKDIRMGNTIQLRTLIAKNDKLDARRLSDMLRLGTFPCAYVAEGYVKELRSLVRTRHGLREQCTKIKVQIQAIVRKQGLVMPRGKSFTKRWCEALYQYMASKEGGIELKYLFDTYLYVKNKMNQLTAEMVAYTKTYFKKEYAALIQKAGIGEVVATYLISEICPISRFKNEKKLRRYAGVIPCSKESANKIYSTYLPKSSSRGLLRWALVQTAHCIVKCDEKMKQYYKRKKREKKHSNKAIMAVARSLSDIIFKTLASLA
jgi:transposase